MKGKVRLDELLVVRGHFSDLDSARAWILGGKVVVQGTVVDKAGTAVRPDVEIHLRGEVAKYASRGGFKLEAALERFGIDVTGWSVLDAGASTGGFTDCLISKGAARVYAVDVGYGQLRGRLATDPRVVVMERTNVSDLRREMLQPPITFCVFDLSYLSFVKAAAIVAPLFETPVHVVGLLKPLFEGVDKEHMQSEATLREVLHRTIEGIAAIGLRVSQLITSPILGGTGTVEFLAELRDPSGAVLAADAVERAISEVGPLKAPGAGESAPR